MADPPRRTDARILTRQGHTETHVCAAVFRRRMPESSCRTVGTGIQGPVTTAGNTVRSRCRSDWATLLMRFASQSRHHSWTLPCMSQSPHGLGSFFPPDEDTVEARQFRAQPALPTRHNRPAAFRHPRTNRSSWCRPDRRIPIPGGEHIPIRGAIGPSTFLLGQFPAEVGRFVPRQIGRSVVGPFLNIGTQGRSRALVV